jgi:hypothetical protein
MAQFAYATLAALAAVMLMLALAWAMYTPPLLADPPAIDRLCAELGEHAEQCQRLRHAQRIIQRLR